jgi:PPOX class probable F420-dependent enzyme
MEATMFDPTTPFGARVARRLNDELIIWLTTTGADGTPQPSPVWFLWTDDQFLIYSQPNKAKLHNIQRNPRVALNFDGDGQGGNIIVFTGEARVDPEAPLASEVAAYVAKYREAIARIKMAPESFAQSYSVALRVTPTRLRGH